jgi:RNA polymerase sigma-70 factor (ECF subfamily)
VEDIELVRQLRARDRATRTAAFDALFRRHHDRVFNTAYRVMGDRALAADVTQETFLTVLNKSRRFDFRSAFTSWLYRVTVNLCIDVKRKRNRRRSLSLSEPETAGRVEGSTAHPNAAPDPETAARGKELAALVSKAIGKLNPRLSVVVVLRYTEGLGYEEIADVLEVPLGTVKSRLNRAHAALEADLGPVLDDYQ